MNLEVEGENNTIHCFADTQEGLNFIDLLKNFEILKLVKMLKSNSTN
jgi:hypothetical protein